MRGARLALLALTTALLGTVMPAAAGTLYRFGQAFPDPSPPLIWAQDGSWNDWDGAQDGRCVFAFCGADLRLCEPGEVPLAQVGVHLRDRQRCPGHRAVRVMGMAAKFECDPAHPLPLPSTTTTTVPRCAVRIDGTDGTCVDGCPCDFDRRRNGVCVFAFFCPLGPSRVACKIPGFE